MPPCPALWRKLDDGTARIGVMGLGYVGLPLCVEFAAKGFRVSGFDVDRGVVRGLNRGRSRIQDVPSGAVRDAVRLGLFRASDGFGGLSAQDAVIICVPTPLRKSKEPDVSYILAASREIAARARPGQLIVLESTTYPGTTRELVMPLLEKGRMRVGKDIFLAFSPERVDPGNKAYGIRNTPKVVGGITPGCTALAARMYGRIVDTVVPVSSAEAAEMVKLLENTFRSVNIGLVNEMALMCGRLGLDVWEIIKAAATKPFGFMPFYPGPGIGGHCIPLDPQYLAWKMKSLNFEPRFIELAGVINAQMPVYAVRRIAELLNRRGKPLKGSRIVVLGVAYKPDVSDVRESPALDVISLLRGQEALVDYHDAYVPAIRVGGAGLSSRPLTDGLLEGCDLAAIVTAHSCVDYRRVLRLAPLVFDARNALDGARDPRLHRL